MRISDWSSDVCSSDLGNEMSNLRTEFNEALGLIEGQPFFVATVTPRSFFKDAGDRRSSLKAGATIKKEDEQLECCTVIAAPSIHNRLQRYMRLSTHAEPAEQYEGDRQSDE